jgi:hypothetical protein
LHSHEDSHRFTDEIGFVRTWIGNFQCLAVELIVDRDRRSHIEFSSSELMHYDIIFVINEVGTWNVRNAENGGRQLTPRIPRPAPLRSRTIDTRIFKTANKPFRCELAENREEFSAWPTEPPRPTEPIA